MSRRVVNLGRPIFLLSLTLLQLFFFGLPALEKFSKSGVGEEKMVEKGRSLRPPAVTLCPYRYNYNGWKKATEANGGITESMYQTWCEAANTTEEFEACIANETFSLDDAVLCASKGKLCLTKQTGHGQNLTSSEFWSWDVTAALDGRCYTLDFDQQIGMDLEYDLLMIQLNKSLSYYLFLHSPDLNLITYNSLTMPIYQGIVDFKQIGNKLCTFMMKLIRHEKINQASSGCNPEPGYSFNGCIKGRLSDIVRCKLPWDKLTTGFYAQPTFSIFSSWIVIYLGYDVCSTKDQFDHFESRYLKLATRDQAYIEESTGCLLPCTYHEYSVETIDHKDINTFGIVVAYGAVSTTVLKEYFIYPFQSLVSDFGGTLGLFVGFSFSMLWEYLKLFTTCASHAIK